LIEIRTRIGSKLMIETSVGRRLPQAVLRVDGAVADVFASLVREPVPL
jgi:hypothetical protein